MMKASKNSVGGQLRQLRVEKRLSQAAFAGRCQLNGWNITREIVARIEGQVRCVSDFELLLLAENLEVPVQQLLPSPRIWKKSRAAYLDGYNNSLP